VSRQAAKAAKERLESRNPLSPDVGEFRAYVGESSEIRDKLSEVVSKLSAILGKLADYVS
jgi:hypothetical protein